MATLLLAFNAAIFITFMAVMGTAWFNGHRQAFFWMIACIFGALTAAIQASFDYFSVPDLPKFLLLSSQLTSIMFLTAGVMVHVLGHIFWRYLLSVLIIGLLINLVILDISPASLMRQIAYQLPYMTMAAISAFVVWRHGRTVAEKVFASILTLFAVQYMIRPAIALITNDQGNTPSLFLKTDYGAIILSIQAVNILMLAAIMIWLMGKSVAVDLGRSRMTERETGLMTRPWFENLFSRRFQDSGLALALIEPVYPKNRMGIDQEQWRKACFSRAADKLVDLASDQQIAFRADEYTIGILFAADDDNTSREACQALIQDISEDEDIELMAGAVNRHAEETLENLEARAREALYHAQRTSDEKVIFRDMHRYVPPRWDSTILPA